MKTGQFTRLKKEYLLHVVVLRKSSLRLDPLSLSTDDQIRFYLAGEIK